MSSLRSGRLITRFAQTRFAADPPLRSLSDTLAFAKKGCSATAKLRLSCSDRYQCRCRILAYVRSGCCPRLLPAFAVHKSHKATFSSFCWCRLLLVPPSAAWTSTLKKSLESYLQRSGAPVVSSVRSAIILVERIRYPLKAACYRLLAYFFTPYGVMAFGI